MELTEVINSRTSVRKYKETQSVGVNIIQELVSLGMRAVCELHRLKIVSPGRLFM